MALANPFRCRLTQEQLDWLDTQRHAAIASRSEAIRHTIQWAMEHQKRQARGRTATSATTTP